MRLLLLLIVSTILTSCSIKKSDKDIYIESLQSSIYPDSSKIDTNLVQINDENENLIRKNIAGEEYILVVTLKQNISYYKDTFNTGNYPIWVTTSPELKDRFSSENVIDTNLRLIQLLGLPPGSKYDYFVEFWVKPIDLFRPCPDKEIYDDRCGLCFPDSVSEEHLMWINENRISRYYQCDLYDRYPWTQLGYTYDWDPKNKTHIGLSEFIISSNRTIYLNKIYSINDYLNN